mmetsp:Transcript_25097/g.52030  ORF Transcript_25097/g.52030 Transcript_25097/m.52030 type:complete len:533 (+) Transcript_25097:103-1701(+)
MMTAGTIDVRQEWNELTDYDRELYLDAVETAIERGLHQRFALWHVNSQVWAHDTCSFFLWHRYFTRAYERMLQSLMARMENVTIPYWNIVRDYNKQEDGSYKCREYGTCSSIVYDLGGKPTGSSEEDIYYRAYFDIEELGWIHQGPPIQNMWDDKQRGGTVRFDMLVERIPKGCSATEVSNLFIDPKHQEESSSLLSTKQNALNFWRRLQVGVHDNVHDTVGGFMRRPASPIDPLFFPWHSTIDAIGYLYEICHHQIVDIENESLPATVENQDWNWDNSCWYTPEAKELYPDARYRNSLSKEWFLQTGSESNSSNISIWEDPLIGSFFMNSDDLTWWNLLNTTTSNPQLGYIYSDNILPEVQELLRNDSKICPTNLKGMRRFSPTKTDRLQPRSSFTAQEISTDFVPAWMDQAVFSWKNRVANDGGLNSSIEQLKSHSFCLFENLDHDTLERWAIDNAFVADIVPHNRIIHHPACQGILLFNEDSIFVQNSTVLQPPPMSSPADRHGLSIFVYLASAIYIAIQGAQVVAHWS